LKRHELLKQRLAAYEDRPGDARSTSALGQNLSSC
jgi:hypothetical protein